MKNNENNLKLTLIRKVAGVFINIGDIHANELSIGLGMYEPKVSMNLLKSSNKVNK